MWHPRCAAILLETHVQFTCRFLVTLLRFRRDYKSVLQDANMSHLMSCAMSYEDESEHLINTNVALRLEKPLKKTSI